MEGDRARAVLIGCTLLYGLGLFADLVLLVISPLALNLPAPQRSPFVWALTGCILLYPLLVLVGLGLGWHAYERGDFARAANLALMPVFAVALFVACIASLRVV